MALLLPLLEPNERSDLDGLEAHQFLYRVRGVLIDRLEQQMLAAFARHYDDIMAGVRVPDLLADSPVMALKSFAQSRIYQAEEKQLLQTNAKQAFDNVLNVLTRALYERHLAGFQRHGYTASAQWVLTHLRRSLPPADLPLYTQYQQALDYVSGMTDPFLIDFARRLQQRGKIGPDRF